MKLKQKTPNVVYTILIENKGEEMMSQCRLSVATEQKSKQNTVGKECEQSII